jgi:hypothetical protein
MLPLSIFKQSGKGYRLFLKSLVYQEQTNSTDARSRPTNFSAS